MRSFVVWMALVLIAVAAVAQYDGRGSYVSGGGGGGSGIVSSIAAYSDPVDGEGGADSLIIRMNSAFGVPVRVGVDLRVAPTAGAHATTPLAWTEIYDEAGQPPSETPSTVVRYEKFTACGDTLALRFRVYDSGGLVSTTTTTTPSNAEYWRWWNYKFPICLTIDDGDEASATSLDSLMTVMGGGRMFTMGVNPVHSLSMCDTIPPLGVSRRATPSMLRGYHQGGNVEIANHAYSAGSLYSHTVRGSDNTGGLISTADTVRAYNAGYWPGDFKANWEGDLDTDDIHTYYNEATKTMLSGYGILHNTSTGSLVWSPWTIEEHFLAEIERDTLVAFGIVPSASNIKTFVYPSYEHSIDILEQIEAEGYLCGRGSLHHGNATARNDLGIACNTWADGISIYRVPIMVDIFAWLDHSGGGSHAAGESDFKSRLASDILSAGLVADGGIGLMTTMHKTYGTPSDSYVTPEEVEWTIEQGESDGGIVKPLGEVAGYWRERAIYHYLIDGDRIFSTSPLSADTLFAAATSDTTPRESANNSSGWPVGSARDLWISDVAFTQIASSFGSGTPDSTEHLVNPNELRVVSYDSYGAHSQWRPWQAWAWFDESSLPSNADIISAKVWCRSSYDNGLGLDLAAGDTLFAVVSHASGDDWFTTLGSGTNESCEANSSWMLQDVDDAGSAWSPPMANRYYDRSWGTWHAVPGPLTVGSSYWYGIDILDGVEAIVEDGATNGGIYIFEMAADGNPSDTWEFEHYNGSVRNQYMWIEIRYAVPIVTY